MPTNPETVVLAISADMIEGIPSTFEHFYDLPMY